jgi:hypothetical protein
VSWCHAPKAGHGGLLESVAGLEISGFKAKLEPVDPLRGTSMGKSVRDYITLRFFLYPIIPDRTGSVQTFLDVSGLQNMAVFIGLIGPNPGKAIRLQFHLYR